MNDLVIGSCLCGGDQVLQQRFEAPTPGRNPFDAALRIFFAVCLECGTSVRAREAVAA